MCRSGTRVLGAGGPGRLTRTARRALTVALTVGVAVGVAVAVPPSGPPPASATSAMSAVARTEPAISLDRAGVAVGDRIGVRLAGWPAGNVQVEVCGNQALRGSVDCAVGGAVSTAVGPAGSGLVVLTVSTPPAACPCVVRVRPISGGQTRTTPLTIDGVPVRSGAAPMVRAPAVLAATEVRLIGADPVGAGLFGGPAHRTVRLTLRNTGQVPVPAPRLVLSSGRPGQTTVIVPAPPVGLLAPGQDRTVELPVTFGAPTWGRYAVRGEIVGADRPVVFHLHTYSYPWGLLALPALVGTLLLVRRWRRAG